MKHNRILIFSTDDHLYPAGGAEQAFGNITERLSHIQFDLICAKLRKGVSRVEQVKNVRIHRVGFGVPRLDGFILALFGQYYAYTLMKKYRYDLIWSIMASYGAFTAVRVKKKIGLPFLLTLQEGDSFEYIYNKVRFVRPQFNEIFKTADAIQAISKYLSRWGTEMGYVGNNNKVIPNGVAIEAFTQSFSESEIHDTRRSFGFPDNAYVLITSSRLEKKNGIMDVVNALPLLPSNVCFVVCGSGSLESSIRSRVEELGLTSRILFKGFVDPEKLPLLMKASNAFIRPSLTEGLGNAFLEAMAARILVLGTNAGGISDFLTHSKTGFLVNIQDPQSIADVVNRCMQLGEDEKRLILDTAETMVVSTYNWNTISKEMDSFFNTITSCTR